MGLISYTNLEDGTPVTANIFNERFAQIIAQLNGNLDENNFKNEGISKEKLKVEVYESIYPVGSMYVNFTNDTNPATLLGFGTWQAVAGRMVVGYDATQTEFNAAEKTGGDKTHNHALTAGRADIAATGSDLKMRRISESFTGNARFAASGGDSSSSSMAYKTRLSGNTDSGDSLSPYIVGYVWKRIS